MLNRLLGKRYRVVQALGVGQFAKTYIVEDYHRPNRPKCVVKVLKPQSHYPEFLSTAKRLFHKEAEILEQLGQHDQIPRSLAYFEENQEFYLVQELIEGHTLSLELPLFHCWSESQVIQMLKDVLPILEFVHSYGVIHRDIKPSNLMRRKKDNRLILIDFGAVKQISVPRIKTNGLITSPTISIGTQGYMPTEQVRGKPRLNSDIYALGVLGIQALTGLDPLYLQEDEEGELIWQDRADASKELTAILNKMVSYHFQDRYQSATQVLEALQSLSKNRQIKEIAIEEIETSSYFCPAGASAYPQNPKLNPTTTFAFRSIYQQIMRIGILSLLFSIISNYTEIAYRQSYLQAQGALESIEVLKAAEKYPDCLQQVETFSQNYSDLETEVENLLQECQQGQAKEELAEARKLAEQSKFKEAILIAAQVPADTNVYFKAQKLIEQWSEKIFLIASNQYQEGKLIQAIALMGNIPAGSSWAEKAEATIEQWNQDWQQNQIYMQSAQKAMDAGHWKKAIKMANKVSHTYYWQKQSNLIIQTAKAKIAAAQIADSTRTRKHRSRSTLPRPKLIPRSRLTEWICLNNPNPKCNK